MLWYYVMMNDGYEEEWVDLFSDEETAKAACADYQKEEPCCTFYIQEVWQDADEMPGKQYIELDTIWNELYRETRI